MNVIRANKKLLGMLLGVALCFGMGNAISDSIEHLSLEDREPPHR